MENIQIDIPSTCTLNYIGEEVKLDTFGIYSSFGNNVQPVSDEHKEYTELYSKNRLDDFVARNIEDIIKEKEVFTTISDLLKTAAKHKEPCYKYEKDNRIFIVQPELYSIYKIQLDSKTHTCVEDYAKSISTHDRPYLELIGKLYEQVSENTYKFNTKSLKMRLLRRNDVELTVKIRDPVNKFKYFTKF